MKLVLIGFMGAGKSTVGKLLAQQLSLPFYEMDEQILALSNRASVNEIFEKDGEARFRALEAEVARACGALPKGVISTGGGAVMSQPNLVALRDGGALLVYLHAPFETLRKRIEGDSARPLFQNLDSARELFDKRQRRYHEASDLLIDTGNLTCEAVATKIIVAQVLR